MSNTRQLLKKYSEELNLFNGHILTLEELIDSHRSQRQLVKMTHQEMSDAINKAVEARVEYMMKNEVIQREKLLGMSVQELVDYLNYEE